MDARRFVNASKVFLTRREKDGRDWQGDWKTIRIS